MKLTAKDWTSLDFWRVYAPELHIDDPALRSNVELLTVGDDQANALRQLIKTEGYFQANPPEWGLPIEAMARLLAKLAADKLPTPLAYIYDEFWLIFIKLDNLIESILGPGYKRLPDFWAWVVDPTKEESGWTPHRDKGFMALRPDGSPKSLTIWLPLTESTTLNGCMYIVPANRDPTYGTPNDREWRFAHADIRALPAAAGSIFCWNQAVLHWGSHASRRAAAPRISLAFEFQAGDVEPFNRPLMEPLTIPRFATRPPFVAKQILQYQHMYPLAEDVRKIAEGLMSETVPG